VWAAGMMLLALLARRRHGTLCGVHPVKLPRGKHMDALCLLEVAALFGWPALERACSDAGRKLSITRLRTGCCGPTALHDASVFPARLSTALASRSDLTADQAASAASLVQVVCSPSTQERCDAATALQHPFFVDDEEGPLVGAAAAAGQGGGGAVAGRGLRGGAGGGGGGRTGRRGLSLGGRGGCL